MLTTNQRRWVERIIVKATIEEALKIGWKLDRVINGEAETKVTTVAKAMEHAFECDEARVYFRGDGHTGWIDIVLGNEGWTVISDYSTNLDDAPNATDDEDV